MASNEGDLSVSHHFKQRRRPRRRPHQPMFHQDEISQLYGDAAGFRPPVHRAVVADLW
jgi:hypothetical protein